MLETAIARAEQVNPAINAIVHQQYEQACKAVAAGLRAIGVEVEEHEDGWTIAGKSTAPGGTVDSRGDHRIAMAFLVAGLRTKKGVTVEGVESVRVSDPGFLLRLRGLTR